MKKMICLVLVVMLVLSVVSVFAEENADGFKLHNGIQFGMTKDEVISTELESNFGLADGRYGEGKIAGYNGAVRCEYNGLDETLDKVCYFYYTTNTNQYNALSNALADKYGTPTHTSITGTYFAVENELEIKGVMGISDERTELPLTGQSINEFGVIYERPGNPHDSWFVTTCRNYEQWLVEQEDGSAVLIDHSNIIQQDGFWNRDKRKIEGASNSNTYELIIYSALTQAEVAAIQQDTMNIHNDL